MTTRRTFLASVPIALTACASSVSLTQPSSYPPIVFVHGNGDNAGIWQTVIWRFESNGWPRDRLHAINLPYPLARDDDTKAQPGRTSTAEHMAFLKSEVDKVLRATGASHVVLLGNSRGGNAIRNYIQNGGGDKTVSHAVLGGVPNHGIWAVSLPPLSDNSEFAGHGAFLRSLNTSKNAAGDEVTSAVKWLTLRSDNNDKYAQPDGLWVGKRGTSTGVGYDSPALRGATNLVLSKVDHRETSFSPMAFAATYRFLTGKEPATLDVLPEDRVVLSGLVTGLGLTSTDAGSGSFANNQPLTGARLEIYALDGNSGERRGAPVHAQTIGADGRWGPFTAQKDTRYEFVLAAAGYATTHIYRSPFPRSSSVVHMRPERVPDADKNAPALAIFNRPRGYFDPLRDKMAFDGQNPPPGAVNGAGVSASRIKPTGLPRTVVGEFNGEKIVGRTWPLAENHVSVLELTY